MCTLAESLLKTKENKMRMSRENVRELLRRHGLSFVIFSLIHGTREEYSIEAVSEYVFGTKSVDPLKFS